MRDDAQEQLPSPWDSDHAGDLVGRSIGILLPPREDPGDLTTYPGGWWSGRISGWSYGDADSEAGMFDFHFADDEGDEWTVQLELRAESYDPYIDPMSESAVYAWYLFEE